MKKRVALTLFVAVAATTAWLRFGPLPPGFLEQKGRISTVIVDRRGEVLYESLSAAGMRSEWIEAARIPLTLEKATLAAEDRRFYLHPGIDPIAVARAAAVNLHAGRRVQGGSTISQQVVKLLSGGSDRSWSAKLRQAVLALRLEQRLSKREILALYLNLAPYGNQIAGAERASRSYFGVASDRLTVAQAALLASLPQAPSRFNPVRNPESAKERQQSVIGNMNIPAAEKRVAQAEQLQFRLSPRSSVAPHFVERVIERGLPAGRVFTTLDADLQRQVAAIIRTQRASLRRHGARHVAVAVLDNHTGQWLAWEGSGDYSAGAIDGVISPRQPGSALKPFTYAAAFEDGFTPATVLPDVPSNFPTATAGIIYNPRNYDQVFRGPLRARYALAGSENVPAVWLLSQIGAPRLLRLLRGAGFTTFDKTAAHYGLGLTLGNAEVRLDELVAAYAVFARGGCAVSTTMILSETAERSGSSALCAENSALFSPDTTFWISDILSDSDAREYVFGSGGSLDFPFPVAVKTGTSQSYRDNWTVGFTRDITVGVWVGNFDREPLRNSSGITGAAPIFHSVMMAAQRHAREELHPRPARLVKTSLCAVSGLAPNRNCAVIESEWLPHGAAVARCFWHRSDGEVQWPGEYRVWARERGLMVEEAASGERPAARRATPRGLAIVSPPEGATYMIDPTLRAEFQAVPLRASASGPLSWSVDGKPVRQDSWPLIPGSHEVHVRDSSGATASVTIHVK